MCDSKRIDGHPFQVVYEKYVTAVVDGSEALPLLLPALSKPLDPADILAAVDGVLMTGSRSNVHPGLYDGPPARHGTLLDEQRDATALDLIRAALDRGTPLFCICRGFQELNVALGGTLHQHVHEIEGRGRHHELADDPLDAQYGPAHRVTIRRGGPLHRIVGVVETDVNSLHRQAIDRLADRLEAEAWAEDSTIEGVSVKDAPGFALGVQWHPEWKVTENPVSLRLFGAFGDAMRKAAS